MKQFIYFLCLFFQIGLLPLWGQTKSGTDFYGTGKDIKGWEQSASYLQDKDVAQLVTTMLSKNGILNRFIIQSTTMVENCQAVLKGGKPYILYNPQFLNRVKSLNFSTATLPLTNDQDWYALSILAHELGHHVNNHLSNPPPDLTQRDLELEADEFSGYMLQLMGASLAQAQLSYLDIPTEGGYTHPPRRQRLDAVARGYNKAKANNNNVNPTPSIGGGKPSIKMVSIPGKDFKMSETEITIGQYLAFCKATNSHWPVWLEQGSKYNIYNGKNDDYKKAGMSESNTNCPIVGVSALDADAFCRWMGGYLPSKAEWEYAAKGGQNYKYAGSDNIDEVAWYDENSGNRTCSVKQKRANGYGLYDMTGNVKEWTSSTYEDSDYFHLRGGKYLLEFPREGYDRIIRGGGWDDRPRGCHVAHRFTSTPDTRTHNIGFRLATSY